MLYSSFQDYFIFSEASILQYLAIKGSFRMSSLQPRYQRLYYPGSGCDPTPLPIAESALYVDPLPSNSPKEFPNGKHGYEPAEKFLLNNLLEMVKKVFLLQEEPIVDWSTGSINHPIAEVLFTWNDMPGLTLNGQTTKLTYLFNTIDWTVTWFKKSLLFGADIFWAKDGMPKGPYFHIDLSKMVIASGQTVEWLPISEDQAKNSKFYHILPLKSCLGKDWKFGMEWSHPEYLPMLMSKMLQQGTMCFEDYQNYARFWLLNYNNQKQDSVIETGGAKEALNEVSKQEKELILVLSAQENDLKSLEELESMGTNIDARSGNYYFEILYCKLLPNL